MEVMKIISFNHYLEFCLLKFTIPFVNVQEANVVLELVSLLKNNDNERLDNTKILRVLLKKIKNKE